MYRYITNFITLERFLNMSMRYLLIALQKKKKYYFRLVSYFYYTLTGIFPGKITKLFALKLSLIKIYIYILTQHHEVYIH